MGQLVELAQASGCDLGELWVWPLDRLRHALAWPESLLFAVDHHRRRLGVHPAASLPDHLLLPMDSSWPDGVRALQRPPLSLFWRGHASLLPLLSFGQAVAVVGSRRASSHGLRAAERLGACLAQAGWPVVSGLAEGIDAAAHRGCLHRGGSPVAVLGTPLERSYPKEHASLQAQVAAQGLVFSELSPGARVCRSSFALRNRLIVALAAHVVVVECPENSGALLSAEAARVQGRALWVIPGDALRWSAQGSNRLLQGCAKPLLDPDHWVKQLGRGPLQQVNQSACSRGSSQKVLAEQDPDLLQLIGDGASLEQLAIKLGRSPSQLSAQLVQLELDGVLTAEPGMRWRLA